MKKLGRTISKRPARAAGRDIAGEIIGGLEEAIAFETGRASRASFRPAPISAREASVAPAPAYSARQIVAVRKRLRVSQTLFAQALNVSPETARAWEQGKFSPGGSVRRLLQIASRHPSVLLEAMTRNGARTKSGRRG